MALDLIKTCLQADAARALNWRMSVDAWADKQAELGDKVAVYRRYAAGDHDAKLTDKMKQMLRIGTSNFDRFNDNYMDIVIQTPTDRLQLTGLETDNDAATQWVSALLDANRLDALQIDVTEAAIRDGNTYLLCSWDKELKQVRLTHELAWDGDSGMMVVHDSFNRVILGVKSWQEQMGNVTRVTLYYPDHIERYASGDDSELHPFEDADGPADQPFIWNGQPIGCPVIHIPNRGTSWDAFGTSEIEDAIPIQNALNRTMHSMVMAAELTAFQVKWGMGFIFPPDLTPGMCINIGDGKAISKDEHVDLGVLEQGEIMPYIQQAQWLTSEIGKITRTPAPEFMGSDTASGEALKQREIGLIGKCKRFQVKAGNRWEDAIRVAWGVQAAFGGNLPPAFETISAQWAEIELRNDTAVIENAKVLAEMGYAEEALRQMAPVFGWGEKKIKELLEQKAQQDQARINQFTSALPSFGAASFGLPSNGGGQRQGVLNNG